MRSGFGLGQPSLNRSIIINEILDAIEAAEPFSVRQQELSVALLDAIDCASPAIIDEATISRMANIVKSGEGFTRVIAARALGEIGPPAKSALPALQRALKVDGEVLKQTFGIAVGPEGPYEAEVKAIRRINGEPEPQ